MSDDLLAIIVKALEPYDIPTGSWTAAEKIEPAQRVLAALGLEQIGWARPGTPSQIGGRIWPVDMPPEDDYGEQAIYRLSPQD